MSEDTKKKRASLKVVGVAGNTDYGYGTLDTGEYLAKLQGIKGLSLYDEMRRSDPQVQAVLKALTLPIRKANYYIEPASDSPKDKEIAEIIGKNLFEGMTMTWDDTLRHALLMLPFGFSILEKVYEVKDDLFQLRKLDPRLPTSIVRWEYNKEKKRLKGPVQQDTDGVEYELPIEKLAIFTSEREGDNWEGISVLRAAYKPWFIKGKMEKVNAIKHDRHGVGIPKAKIPQSIKQGSTEWTETENMLEGLYANENMYIIEPEGYEISVLGSGGDKAGTDVLPTIKYYDEMIAKAMLAMFVNLGTSDTGSRALGGSFIEVFMDSLQAYADYFCEVMTRFVIVEYVDYNWYVEDYPKLKVGQIKKLDTHTIAVLAKAGVITSDDEVENAIRMELNLPEKVEDEEIKKEEIKKEEGSQDNKDDIDEIDEEEIEEEYEKDKSDEEKENDNKKLSDKRRVFQDLCKEELIPDLIGIEMRLNEDSRTLSEQVLVIRKDQANDIILQIVAGRKPNKMRIIKKGEMHSLLFKEYKRQIRIGRQEVREELARQIGKKGNAFNDEPEDYADFVEFGDATFSVEVEGAGNKLHTMLLFLALGFKRQGLSGSALQTAMLNSWEAAISTQTWNKMADSSVNGGWGAGRTIEGNKRADEIEYAYYSSVLDNNTCIPCADKDGHNHPVGDPEYATPSPECYGGGYCRCITVFVHKSESEGLA